MKQPYDPVDLRGQAEEREMQKHLDDQKQRQQEDDIRWLMSFPSGRRIVWRLLDRAGIYRSTFHTSGSVMAHNEGKRDMGLFLLAELHAITPTAYLEMLTEAQK